MKHLFHTLCVVTLLLTCSFQSALAQMQMPPIPMDQKVCVGKLDNGMTYYIRHNALPAKRAEFYIAQKVGSILEEPEQRGLAHFLEHMCFNGTKNFPGNEKGMGIVQWCESKGIKFGADLNAATGVEMTLYNISNVPVENPAVMDSCLLILHDWSSDVILQDKEIDKERGVIHEEWRSRNEGMMRLWTAAQPVIYPGTKYADCMPIGSIDVIDNFKYQSLRDYYQKWYRPDLQGLIIVGDFDVDEMEQKIKNTFANIKKPVNPAERTYYPVPDNQEPLVFVGKDKELSRPNVTLYFKHDATPDSVKQSMAYLLQDYIVNMAVLMLDARYEELAQSANPPFTYAGTGYSNFFLSATKDAFIMQVDAKNEDIKGGIEAGLVELERARRFGFTESEYERARANFLQHIESLYRERDKTKNSSYVKEYVKHFLNNEPTPGIEFEYNLYNRVVPNIPVMAVNQAIKELITDHNQAVMVMAPEKEGVAVPTEADIKTLLKGMKDLKLEAYVDKVSNEPLIKELPKGGKIVSEVTDGIYGTTVLTLSNGVKVYVKKTDFKADEIMMRGVSMGGTSLYPDADKLELRFLTEVAAVGGVGNFSNIDLQKLLAGKKASASVSIGNTTENISGSCSPKDFETMMQLTYLRFTAPRQDAEAFASFKSRTKAQLEAAKANPMASFNDSVNHTLVGYHPRYFSMQPEMVDQIDYDRIMQIYKERFADAGDFSFFLVGNIDLEAVKPLIAQYLGALPAAGHKETFRDNKMYFRKGIIENVYAKEQQTPMATILMLYHGKVKYSLKNSLLMSMFSQVMGKVYTEEIREKEGGTYGVQVLGGIDKVPAEEGMVQIVYQTDPSKKDHLNAIIQREMVKMSQEGPAADMLQKVKDYILKQFANSQKENGYWLGSLYEHFTTGMDRTLNYEATVNAITADEVKQFATDLLKQGNCVTVVMTVPE